LVTVDLSGLKIGLAVCYDLRFPEMFRHYALEGVQLVLIPAEWPTQRIDHWNILTRARAIENQLFVAAVNRCGSGADGEYGGHSILVGPWGELILEAGADECLLTAAIDLDEIPRARKKIDILHDRHPEIY
jgi:predicted amidohydrolase